MGGLFNVFSGQLEGKQLTVEAKKRVVERGDGGERGRLELERERNR